VVGIFGLGVASLAEARYGKKRPIQKGGQQRRRAGLKVFDPGAPERNEDARKDDFAGDRVLGVGIEGPVVDEAYEEPEEICEEDAEQDRCEIATGLFGIHDLVNNVSAKKPEEYCAGNMDGNEEADTEVGLA
jgi:hypothetical protein